MSRKWLFVLGLVLGLLIGWFFGILQIPLFELNSRPLLIVLCLSLLLLLISVYLISRVLKSKSSNRTQNWKQLLLAISASLLVSISSTYLISQYNSSKYSVNNSNLSLDEKSELINEFIRNSQISTVNQFLTKIVADTNSKKTIILNNENLRTLAHLSKSLTPFHYNSSDTLVKRRLSPGRAYLLMNILQMNLDSSSLEAIISRVSFAYADLRNVDLSNYVLNGIDLRHADFSDSKLMNIKLNKSNLEGAFFLESNLNRAELNESKLMECKMDWAQMKHASLRNSNLNGTSFRNAVLNESQFENSKMLWTDFHNTKCLQCDLREVDFSHAKFEKSDISNANMERSRMIKTVIRNSNLSDVSLDNALILKKWMTEITSQNVIGSDRIKMQYSIKENTEADNDFDRFYLSRN